MKSKTLLLIGSLLALAGCQSSEVLIQSSQNNQTYTQVSALNYLPITLPSSQTVQINQQTQRLTNKLMDSPVTAFKLPADRGKLEITITSQIGDSVFSPLVMMVDDQGNIIDQYGADVFEYKRAQFIYGDRLVANIDFYPPTNQKTVNMLIYSNQAELAKHTNVVHPARAMAEAKGNHMPEMKDIPKPHAQVGELLVEIDGSTAPQEKQTAEKGQSTIAQQNTITPQAETANYYINAIQTAVKSDNLDKAFALLEEAKALNIEGAQQAFIEAVNSNKGK